MIYIAIALIVVVLFDVAFLICIWKAQRDK